MITVGFLNAISVSAQTPTTFATFEIGQALIDGYDLSTETTTPFTTITFDRPFENIPNVFTMTPEFDGADDPCLSLPGVDGQVESSKIEMDAGFQWDMGKAG